MLQDRQVERMVQKVARLEQMYGEFLIKAVLEPKVTTLKNGKEIQVNNGYKWGSDFKCQTFSFTVENIDENEKHYVFAAFRQTLCAIHDEIRCKNLFFGRIVVSGIYQLIFGNGVAEFPNGFRGLRG